MTRDEIIDLLTFARVYDSTVTVGKAEVAAWFLAVNRVPLTTAERAVTEHYTAPIEPGHAYPRIAPGHVMAYYQANNRPYDKPLPMLPAAKADPEFVARVKAELAPLLAEAANKYAMPGDDDESPLLRPGMDKREVARRQVESFRRLMA